MAWVNDDLSSPEAKRRRVFSTVGCIDHCPPIVQTFPLTFHVLTTPLCAVVSKLKDFIHLGYNTSWSKFVVRTSQYYYVRLRWRFVVNAGAFTDIATTSFKTSRWPGALRSCGGKFGARFGWNQSFPVFESVFDRILHTRVDIPNYMAEFRRGPVKASKASNTKEDFVLNLASQQAFHVRVCLAKHRNQAASPALFSIYPGQ